MSNLLVIFGITGQQGSSVANKVLSDPDLSKTYKIRGITRDPSKPDAQALQHKGVDIVKCDLDDRASIKSALQDAHTVFAMTATMYKPGGMKQELAQGKAIADEAVAAGVKFFIYSSVPSPRKISGGKYLVDSFDIKDEVKDYVETLPLKAAFFWPGSFMQNFHGEMAPRPGQDGELAWTNFVSPMTKFPLIDIAGDTGKFVGGMLAEPNKFVGKTVCAATRTYTVTEMCEIMSKSCGKPIKYNQVLKDIFGTFLPEAIRETLLNMLAYFEEFGYYGPETDDLVRSAADGARGQPVEFEHYLKREPLKV